MRHLAAIVIALIALGLAIGRPAAAGAATSRDCARAVINDWYGDSQIDKRYAPHCYRDAVASLSPDQKDYLHADEDILRALAYAKAGKQDPGAAEALTDEPNASPKAHIKPAPPAPGLPKTPTSDQLAVDDVSVDGAASIPLPLILLGGLAVTLLGAGGIGMVSRRLRASRDNDAG